ncbi:MAG: hypothetical protein ACRDZ3_05155 [Acidimicrobiia bacterium]
MLPAVINYCPRCGAAFEAEVLGEWIRANIRCPDCRLAITEVPAMLAPSDDEVGYELDDWPVTDRGAVSAALAEADIPFRWEDGLTLVVPGPEEERVDQLLDQIQADLAGPTSEDALDDEDEADVADGGEEAQAAMADLFVVADRLQHEPFNQAIGDALAAVTAVVSESLPPFGIDPADWKKIATMASTVVGHLEAATDDDGEAIITSAKDLRSYLRDYV